MSTYYYTNYIVFFNNLKNMSVTFPAKFSIKASSLVDSGFILALLPRMIYNSNTTLLIMIIITALASNDYPG